MSPNLSERAKRLYFFYRWLKLHLHLNVPSKTQIFNGLLCKGTEQEIQAADGEVTVAKEEIERCEVRNMGWKIAENLLARQIIPEI